MELDQAQIALPSKHYSRGTMLQKKKVSKKHMREMWAKLWTAALRNSWRKIEMTAQDRAGWRRVVCGL